MLSGSAQKLAMEDEPWKEIMSFNKANKIILISKKHWAQDVVQTSQEVRVWRHFIRL